MLLSTHVYTHSSKSPTSMLMPLVSINAGLFTRPTLSTVGHQHNGKELRHYCTQPIKTSSCLVLVPFLPAMNSSLIEAPEAIYHPISMRYFVVFYPPPPKKKQEEEGAEGG